MNFLTNTQDIQELCTWCILRGVNKHAGDEKIRKKYDLPLLWENAKIRFRGMFSSLVLNHAMQESPLSCVVDIGIQALPKLVKLSQVQRANKTEWTQEDEIPVELPLPESSRFHSVFVCPVSKDTATSHNPPMRLNCGHIICHDCVERLGRNGTIRFKCPYCPIESHSSQISAVYF